MPHPKRRAMVAAVSILALLSTVVTLASESAANWRFGRMKLTPVEHEDGVGLRIYTSLRNVGDPSGEKVELFLLGEKPKRKGPEADDAPLADLTERCTDVVSAVFDESIDVPEELREETELRLFLMVGGEVTDMMPIEDGDPQPSSKERKRFQEKVDKPKRR